MREWCVVLDTPSKAAARKLGKALKREGVDVDVEASVARVWCFAETEGLVRELERRVVELAASEPLLQGPPMVRVWSEQHYRYVDPAVPDEDPDSREVWIDSDVEPSEIRWRVRLKLESVFEFRRVRRQLPSLRRPVIGTGNRTIDLGARDATDAHLVATRAAELDGVVSTEAKEIHSWLRRWLIRQELAGNYAVDLDGSGPGYGYSDGFAWGGGDGGGGGNGGGGNGGGGH